MGNHATSVRICRTHRCAILQAAAAAATVWQTVRRSVDGAKKGVGGLGLLACLETEMLNIHGQGMQAQEGRGGEEIDRGRMGIIA